MTLRQIELMKDLKNLLLAGDEVSAFSVADEIARDLIDSQMPNLKWDDPKLYAQVIFGSSPNIVKEAKRQLNLDDWDNDTIKNAS